MILSHNSLENYFRTNFAMMQHHKYSLSEIENLMPWEREIYLSLLQQFIREENERIKNQNKDLNGDGQISAEEMEMDIELKRKKLEDEDAMRDAQRKMAWFALFGMLLYPFAVVLANWVGLDQASKILGDMAATYFVSVAAIVAAFFGTQAYTKKK